MRNSLTVLVPMFNEEQNIEMLVAELEKISSLSFRVIFIDDKSDDSTLEILQSCLTSASFPYLVISKHSNEGKSSCIETGIQQIETSHFVILDADLELKPSEIVKLWSVVESNQGDAVFGYRSFRSHSSFTFRYVVGNRILSFVFGMIFNQVITDLMCGYKLLPTSLVRHHKWRLKRFGVELELAYLLWQKGIRPHEIEVDYKAKGWDSGKVIGVWDALYILTSMFFLRLLGRRLS